MDSLSSGNASKGKLTDELGPSELGNVYDESAAVAVRQISAVAFHMDGAVAGKFGTRGRQVSGLLRQREAANLPWIARIGDVHHAVNFSGQPRRAGCGMN